VSVPTHDGHGLKLLSADDLAQRLGRDRRWIYRQVSDHGLPALKLGRELCFQVAAVDRWLASRRVGDWTDGEDA
jgi:excisionase family DNA binding protein